MAHDIREVEEIVKEFDHTFFENEHYEDIKTGAKFCGCYEGDIGDIFPETRNEVLNWLRTTLTAQLQKAREEERRKVLLEVLDLPAVGINLIDREDVKALNHSELDQDKQ